MALDLKRPHPYVKRGDFVHMLPPNNYICLIHGTETGKGKDGKILYDTQKLYINSGQVYLTENQPISLDDVDTKFPWFWDEYRKVDPQQRREMGLLLPEEAPEVEEVDYDEFLKQLSPDLQERLKAELATQQELWHCDKCEQDVHKAKKQAHVLMHARQAKKQLAHTEQE